MSAPIENESEPPGSSAAPGYDAEDIMCEAFVVLVFAGCVFFLGYASGCHAGYADGQISILTNSVLKLNQ